MITEIINITALKYDYVDNLIQNIYKLYLSLDTRKEKGNIS